MRAIVPERGRIDATVWSAALCHNVVVFVVLSLRGQWIVQPALTCTDVRRGYTQAVFHDRSSSSFAWDIHLAWSAVLFTFVAEPPLVNFGSLTCRAARPAYRSCFPGESTKSRNARRRRRSTPLSTKTGVRNRCWWPFGCRPHCQHAACLKPASFAKEAGMKPSVCAGHKEEGMVDVVHPNR